MSNELTRERNKRNVIEQATKLCVTNGVERTTIGLVAKAANVTPRSVLNYFATKNDLIMAVMERILANNYACFDEFLAADELNNASGKEQIISIIRYILYATKTQYASVNCLTEIEVMMARENTAQAARYYTGSSKRVTERFTAALEKGIAEGDIRANMVPDETAATLSCSVRGMYRQMSIIYQSSELIKAYHPDEMIQNYLGSVRRMLDAAV